ncbi:MAG: acetamidase/formamidase family protein [Pseudomonadota bacterium]
MRHVLPASVETCHWGYFDAEAPPALTIASGDVVEVETLSGGPEVLPPEGFQVPAALRDIHARSARPLPGHILTGPIAVEGAAPGDALEVRLRDIRLGQDWGWNFSRPLVGALPERFTETHLLHLPLDAQTGVARLPWGDALPLAPFFGVIGTAPPPGWGRVTSLVPRAFGGNLDLKELVAGATLWLPVFTPGGLLSLGDGHAAQGDGEVNVTAIETALTGEIEVILHKGAALPGPRAETPTHLIEIGLDPSLDQAAKKALSSLIDRVSDLTGLAAEDAYALCSMSADLRVTQVVNGEKGVHAMLHRDRLAFAA